MNEKKILEIAKRFKHKTQKIIDDGKGITKITMQIGDEPPVIIAEKKDEQEEKKKND